MVLLKENVEPARTRKTQIVVYQCQKLKVFHNQKEHLQQKKKKAAGKKGKTVVSNTPKAKVKLKNGGEVRRIARGCGKVMSNRRKKNQIFLEVRLAYLYSNIPYFKCWVRREYTHNHDKYHGEFLHAMAIGVTTMPTRCLSFHIIFTGIEAEGEPEDTIHGGAMWARMPITALVGDTPFSEWPEPMAVHDAQPWDCSSHTNSVYVINRATPCPWMAKIDGQFFSC